MTESKEVYEQFETDNKEEEAKKKKEEKKKAKKKILEKNQKCRLIFCIYNSYSSYCQKIKRNSKFTKKN